MKWQKIFKDFAKRFPSITIGDIFNDANKLIFEMKFSDLTFIGNGELLAFGSNGRNIFKIDNHKQLYFSVTGWKEISNLDLLRLLVDGAEDGIY